MSARRRAVTIFLLFLGLTCVWVPWRAPSMYNASKDNEIPDPRPDPSGATVYLGYGWLWKGSRILQGSDKPSESALADYEKLGRMKATSEAHSNFREPTEAELEARASFEREIWSARISVTRMFYRNHANPDFPRIMLTLAAGAAIAGVLWGLMGLVRREAPSTA